MQNILLDIHQYNAKLTISQMLTLLERKGVSLSKSMVQNYVRDGLLPPPLNKRHYTPQHLTTLVMISALKTVYELCDVKTALQAIITEEGIPLDTYNEYVQKTNNIKNPDSSTDILTLMLYSVDIKDEVLRRLP